MITHPVNQSVTVGSGAIFTAAFTGNPVPTIQWQISTDGGHTFTDISGATSGTLSVSSATASQSGNEYRAVGSNSVDKNVPSNAAKLTVITIPAIVTAPAISSRARSVKVGQKLTCSHGSWTESPTAYTYRWSRDGTPIAGARSPTYTVQQLDEGNTLTCIVTATNPAGRGSPATSRQFKIRVPFVRRCPAATGSLSGTKLGLLMLGMTRAQAQHAYTHSSSRGKAYEEFFCLTPRGVRVGCASPKEIASLPQADRARYAGRVIWISTSSAHYAIDGVRVGATVQAAAEHLRLEPVFVVGLDDWYLAPVHGARGILKVRHGIVEELGIADAALTLTRSAQRTFLTSFG